MNRRVIELRGDIKALSEEIKTLLEVALARPAAAESSDGGVASISESGVAVARPFALCNGVAPGSPAAQAVSEVVAITSFSLTISTAYCRECCGATSLFDSVQSTQRTIRI